MDDNQKKFIPQLAIDTEFFPSFTKDLLNEPTFGRIHLAGQSFKASNTIVNNAEYTLTRKRILVSLPKNIV